MKYTILNENFDSLKVYSEMTVYFPQNDDILSILGSLTFSLRIVYVHFQDRIFSFSGSYTFSHDRILNV